MNDDSGVGPTGVRDYESELTVEGEAYRSSSCAFHYLLLLFPPQHLPSRQTPSQVTERNPIHL